MSYSLRIDELLKEISIGNYRDDIINDTVGTIIAVLNGRLSDKSVTNFKLFYGAECGKTLSVLIAENYDIENLIYYLRDIIKENIK